MSTAHGPGLTVTIESAQEAEFVVQRVQNAFQGRLAESVDTGDAGTKWVANALNNLLYDVAEPSSATSDAFGALAREIVKALPFDKHEPQVTREEPGFVAPSKISYPVTFTFFGNFEFAGEDGFTPALIVGNQRIQPSTNTARELQFLVPASELLADVPTTDPAKFAFTHPTLDIPWHTTGFFEVMPKKRIDSYRLTVGVLPMQAGTITATFQAPQTSQQLKDFRSGEYYLSSGSDGQDLDHPDVLYAVHPDDGWHVVPNTSMFIVGAHTGDWCDAFVSDSGNVVKYNVSTLHAGLYGATGKVSFAIGFTERQDGTGTTPGTESIKLNWGDVIARSYPSGMWKLVFDGFDGSHSEFTKPDSSNKFLAVSEQPGGVVIRAADPSAVSWP